MGGQHRKHNWRTPWKEGTARRSAHTGSPPVPCCLRRLHGVQCVVCTLQLATCTKCRSWSAQRSVQSMQWLQRYRWSATCILSDTGHSLGRIGCRFKCIHSVARQRSVGLRPTPCAPPARPSLPNPFPSCVGKGQSAPHVQYSTLRHTHVSAHYSLAAKTKKIVYNMQPISALSRPRRQCLHTTGNVQHLIITQGMLSQLRT